MGSGSEPGGCLSVGSLKARGWMEVTANKIQKPIKQKNNSSVVGKAALPSLEGPASVFSHRTVGGSQDLDVVKGS